MLPRAISVKPIDNSKLLIIFNNDEERLFDVSPYLHYPVYELLNDPLFFKKARVFNGTIIWDDTIDFAPETLYMESTPVVNVVK
jgi:hypothetical protein